MELSFSISKSQASLGQKVGVALAKKTLDIAEQKGQQTVEMIKASHPALGKNIDLKA